MLLSGRKIFCIGQNKTGTTSIEHALQRFGFRLGDQRRGELLLDAWYRRDFSRIVRHCRTAVAFQDIPFSLDYTYIAVDIAFKGSKFILTVRDTPEQWYRSLVNFHAKLLGVNGTPTAADVARYLPGDRDYHRWLWKYHALVYGVDEARFFDREIYVERYQRHNRGVIDYFGGREQDLLVLNVAHADALERLCRFLGRPYGGGAMPHLNKT